MHEPLFDENDTAKLRGCFIKMLRSVGNRIQTILSPKNQTCADAYFIIKCLSNVLMSYQWETKFRHRGSKIRDLTWNLQQNHLSFCNIINMCGINLFIYSNLVSRVSWLSGRDECALLHTKKLTCPGYQVLYLVTAWKLNCSR